MATQTEVMRNAFQYAPGNGYRYVWSKGQAVITVERIETVAGTMSFVDTGATIPAPERNTAAALMAAVDEAR
jgi:hypothetical protein